jgi:hypothetical protein
MHPCQAVEAVQADDRFWSSGGGSEREDALSSAFSSIALDNQQAQGVDESDDPLPKELQAWSGLAANIINVRQPCTIFAIIARSCIIDYDKLNDV